MDGNVYQSSFNGVDIITYETFLKDSTVHFDLVLPSGYEDGFLSKFSKLEGSPYDALLLVTFGIKLTLTKLFNTPMPKSLLWNVSGAYICTELVQDMLGYKPDVFLTPYQLYQELDAFLN